MAKRDIGSEWNRDNRNKLNQNFDELFGDFENIVEVVSEKAYGAVIEGARLEWKEPVDTFGDLPNTDVVGETRMVQENGRVYRYNGDTWTQIQQVDANAINDVDSRLSGKIDTHTDKDEIHRPIYVDEAPELENYEESDIIMVPRGDDTHGEVLLDEIHLDPGAIGSGTSIRVPPQYYRRVAKFKLVISGRWSNLGSSTIRSLVVRINGETGGHTLFTILEHNHDGTISTSISRASNNKHSRPTMGLMGVLDSITEITFTPERIGNTDRVFFTSTGFVQRSETDASENRTFNGGGVFENPSSTPVTHFRILSTDNFYEWGENCKISLYGVVV